MNRTEYNQIVDDLMFLIEETIEDSSIDIDCENSGGMLTLTIERNASQIILSRQTATSELWLADRSGGFHFVLRAGQWHDTKSGETLADRIQKAILSQAGEALEFSL